MHKITPTTREDCLELAGTMRAEDQAEVRASGSEPLDALLKGLDMGECFTVRGEENILVCIYGCIPVPGNERKAVIWMLGSDQINQQRIEFLRVSQRIIKGFLKHHPVLTNWVDARNVTHVRWLVWLGAVFTSTAVMNNVTFMRFNLCADQSQS